MATKESKSKNAKILVERTYIIPLRKEVLNSPRYKRAKRAVNAVKRFLQKHMKSDKIKIGKYLNLHLWSHGIKNPPMKVKVNVTKDENGLVFAEIFNAPKEVAKEENKSSKKETSKKDTNEEKNENKEETKVEEKEERTKPTSKSKRSKKSKSLDDKKEVN